MYAGGSGSLTGSIVGAALLTVLPEVLRFLSEWRIAVYAAVLVIVMLYRSDGLVRRQGTAVYADSSRNVSCMRKPLFARKGGEE